MTTATKSKQPTKAGVLITARAKAFSGQGIRPHRMLVDDVNVRVWDDVAGYYTLCHCLTPAAVKRIIRRAAGN
jgi:hypothetical protein